MKKFWQLLGAPVLWRDYSDQQLGCLQQSLREPPPLNNVAVCWQPDVALQGCTFDKRLFRGWEEVEGNTPLKKINI
jgi:hypothetical protein